MIKIISDSTCDISDEFLEKYDISIAPLSVRIGDKVYKDRTDLSSDDYYALLPTLENIPTTAMPSPNSFLELFKKAKEDGYKKILCITMSSGTSGSYQSAIIAKEYYLEEKEHIEVYVVDSKCMSSGSGYLILKSAMLREKGASFDDLIDFNETYKTNIKHFLAVDDLENLLKSGRLTNVSAMIGKFLKVKPIMSMRNGKGAIVAKVRGLKKVFDHYAKEFIKRVDLVLTDFIIISYTSDKNAALSLKTKILAETKFTGDILIFQMGIAVGTHVGLGGIAMFFVEKGHRHDGLIYNEMATLIEKKDKLLGLIKDFKNRK